MITRMQMNIHGHLKFSQRWNKDQRIFLQKVMTLKILLFCIISTYTCTRDTCVQHTILCACIFVCVFVLPSFTYTHLHIFLWFLIISQIKYILGFIL
uniref:Uncharacterized protein n=1 Tax=Pyxicephalus adspersus TaxID=30357 RepID=A0AAV3ARJ9_PYXAD|nr:TPA: hypothetical protein GDO54_011260 [Pyxicephalus adspersus]